MLSERVTEYVSPRVRVRGEAYFRDGHVQLHDFDSDGRVEAIVIGTQCYAVTLEIERSARLWILWGDCTCPYVSSTGDFCKHMWATLRAVEEQEQAYLTGLGPVPNRVEFQFLDEADQDRDDWDDDLDDSEDEAEKTEQSGDGDIALGVEGHPAVSPLEFLLGAKRGGIEPGYAGRRRTKRAEDKMPVWQRVLRDIPSRVRDGIESRSLDDSPIEPIYVLETEEDAYANSPVLSLAHQQVMASGKLGKIKKLSLTTSDVARVHGADDRKICMLLLGAGAADGVYGSYGAYGYESQLGHSMWRIPAPLQPELLPLVAQSGRFMLRDGRRSEPSPLTCDSGEPWELVLSIRSAEEDGAYVMTGRLRRGDEYRALDHADCFIKGSPALFVDDGVLHQVETHGCFAWIEQLRAQPAIPIARAELPKLLGELARLRVFPPVEWPSDWKPTEIDDLAPRPELSLRIEAPNSYRRDYPAECKVTFHYGDSVVAALTPGRLLVDTSGMRLVQRQPETEQRLVGRLLGLGVRHDPYYDRLDVRSKKIPTIISTLLEEGWTVLGNRKLYRRAGEFKINVSSGIDWFELDGQVDFDGQAAKLPELLAALRDGERFVRLGDGSFGMLPEAWLARHRGWMDLGQSEDGHLRFSKTQVGLIDALLAELPEATFDRNVTAARTKLARFAGVKPRREPPGFRGELRHYQREGLGWLRFLDEFDWGGCLADDMGLGKTVQLLALLADRRRQGQHGPSLVVAPKSVVFNWLREAERFAPRLRIVDYTGLGRKHLRDGLSDHNLVLTTYGTLRRDIKFLRDQTFNHVVLDEAQAIKNPDSQTAKAARLLQARRRLALTGTPIENHLGDLWSIIEFLNPGMLGTVKAFKGFAGNGDTEQQNLPLLQRMLRPFILRRTKEQVAPELPERSEQTIHCELSSKQATYYRELRDHYRASLLARVDEVGLARSKMHVLEALLRLRQAACHPGLIDESKSGAESAKLETLLAMVTELVEEGHKALVFSQFTKMLALVRAAFDRRGLTYAYLDGRTRDRASRIDRFQNDAECSLFLISLKAGGTGLNLTAADYVFILDPWWNPAVEAQAIDRTHRIGQDKKVIAYRLIARDTVEAKILELQQSKRKLAEAIITQQNSVIRTLTRDDLTVLLS